MWRNSLAQVANAIAFQIATKQAGTWGSPPGLSKDAAQRSRSHIRRLNGI